MPEVAELNIYRPPSHKNMSSHDYEKLVATEVAQREQAIASETRATGQTFMGMDTVLKQSHRDKPNSFELRRKQNPRFAAINKWLRVNAIQR